MCKESPELFSLAHFPFGGIFFVGTIASGKCCTPSRGVGDIENRRL
jgi:hypothetical protein